MARRVQERRSNKRIYACDTFEGFDPAEISREKRSGDASDCHDYIDSDVRYVRRKLERLGVADQVILVRGLFQDTLESLSGPFCFAFIDCDLHNSMLYAARTVWARLSPGGCCVFDDYGNDHFRGATRAIDTFIAEQLSSICEHGCLTGKMYFAVKTAQDTS
jgi:O-methyltransferase